MRAVGLSATLCLLSSKEASSALGKVMSKMIAKLSTADLIALQKNVAKCVDTTGGRVRFGTFFSGSEIISIVLGVFTLCAEMVSQASFTGPVSPYSRRV